MESESEVPVNRNCWFAIARCHFVEKLRFRTQTNSLRDDLARAAFEIVVAQAAIERGR